MSAGTSHLHKFCIVVAVLVLNTVPSLVPVFVCVDFFFLCWVIISIQLSCLNVTLTSFASWSVWSGVGLYQIYCRSILFASLLILKFIKVSSILCVCVCVCVCVHCKTKQINKILALLHWQVNKFHVTHFSFESLRLQQWPVNVMLLPFNWMKIPIPQH